MGETLSRSTENSTEKIALRENYFQRNGTMIS
jgi:hypothetical protein